MNGPPPEAHRHLLRRSIAYTVDALLTIAVLSCNFLVILAGVVISPSPDELTAQAVVMNLASLLCTSVVGFGYFLGRDGLPGGASIGKRIAGVRVVMAGTGDPCTIGRSFLRNGVLMALGAIDLAVPFFRATGRRIGDDVAGTVVVGKP